MSDEGTARDEAAGDHEAFIRAVVEVANRWGRSPRPTFPITVSLRIGRYGGSPCPEVVELWQGELEQQRVLGLIPELQGFLDCRAAGREPLGRLDVVAVDTPPSRREAPPEDF